MNEFVTSKDLLFGLLWSGIGCLYAVFNFRSLAHSLRNIGSGNNPSLMLAVTSGALMRLLVMGLLLYVSIRIKVIFTLVLVVGFSLSRFILIRNYSRKADQPENGTGI